MALSPMPFLKLFWTRDDSLGKAPSMDRLIREAETGASDRVYYHYMLLKALRLTGNIVCNRDQSGIRVYLVPGTSLSAGWEAKGIQIKSAYDVAVPKSLLVHWLPDDRGTDFPDIGFVPISV